MPDDMTWTNDEAQGGPQARDLRVLVLQHVAVEHPGSFREVMAEAGHRWHPVQLDEGEAIPGLDGFDAMLVMGGPQDVWQEADHPWLRQEKAAIRAWVGAGRPFLGMCLGEQLLAEALGGRVGPMQGPPEVGMDTVWLTPEGEADPLFRGVPAASQCFQWHGAEVQELPPGARLLATSPGCRVQAFGYGRHAYGLQYHVELTDRTAREWGALPAYAEALAQVMGAGALPRLEAEIASHLDELRGTARQIFTNFAAVAQGVLAQRRAA